MTILLFVVLFAAWVLSGKENILFLYNFMHLADPMTSYPSWLQTLLEVVFYLESLVRFLIVLAFSFNFIPDTVYFSWHSSFGFTNCRTIFCFTIFHTRFFGFWTLPFNLTGFYLLLQGPLFSGWMSTTFLFYSGISFPPSSQVRTIV